MKHEKALSPDQVKAKLKRLATRRNKQRLKWAMDSGISTFKVLTYRTVLEGYKVRLGVFKGSNWSFNPETLFADSYNWWPMLMVIKGKLVRNRYNYSRSTSGHQWTIDAILEGLGIKPDLTLFVRASLKNTESVKAELLETWAKFEVQNKYARKKRKRLTRWNHVDLDSVKAIGIRFSKAAKANALKEAEADRRYRLDEAKRRKQERNETKVRVNELFRSAPAPVKRHLTLVEG